MFSPDSQWGTADAEITVPSVENPEMTYVLLLEPGVGQNRSMRASPTARNVFLVLISTFPVPSPLFFQILTLLIFEMRYF